MRYGVLFGFSLALVASLSAAETDSTLLLISDENSSTAVDLSTPKTDADRLSYSLGAITAEHIKEFGHVNTNALFKGINDVLVENSLDIPKKEMLKIITAAHNEQEKQRQKQRSARAALNLEKGKEFLIENSRRADVVMLDSGLQYKIIREGKGPVPEINSKVRLHYEGKTVDGTVFDSSYDRGESVSLIANQVILGFTEALQIMPAGSEWEIYLPTSMAYGQEGLAGKVEPNEALIFRIELLDVEERTAD